MFDKEAVDKLPTVFKTLIGFALFCVGVYQIGFATLWADGNIQLFYIFVALGVLYIVNGVPSLLDGVMTMFANKRV